MRHRSLIPGASPARSLVLGTTSFFLCFAAWGLVSAFAPRLRETFSLSATRAAVLIAVPVLLGALGRIPLGLLTDRFGGRRVFGILMLVTAAIVWAIPARTSYTGLVVNAFFLGLAGSSFSVGVGFVSRWTAPARQGTALGIYGLGTGGQSAAVFLGPLLASAIGMAGVFHGVAVLLAGWGILFILLARDAPGTAGATTAAPTGAEAGAAARSGASFAAILRQPLAWCLAAFYFLTFGGFVAFGVYLPSLLRDQFALAPADAGFRAAGFVVLATAVRPVGGWLSDRIGSARVLSVVFLAIVPFALLLAWPAMLPFTVGALGCAVFLGLGNGAVFKLVPQYFPRETGTVSGLVGAMGGLGGFFPPLLLGVFRDRLGAVWPGFVLLAALSIALRALNARVFVPREAASELALQAADRRRVSMIRAAAWATVWTALLAAAIVVGSRNLQHFDPALVIYTFAVIIAFWGTAYHYLVWIEKPPTAIYWRRGWELLRRRGIARNAAAIARDIGGYIVVQRFIGRRSSLRWAMHQAIFWGCLLAVAITFPLVFGWIHFETEPSAPMSYVAYLWGFPAFRFPIHSPAAWLLFHGLDIAAVLVIAGVALSLRRRTRDLGARTLQSFGMDFLPVVLLFAVSLTGLALTISAEWFRGGYYGFLAILHAVTVVATLLYLPFGKFFHVFQRPAQLGVKLYQRAGAEGPPAECPSCGESYASRLQMDDLAVALDELGFDYRVEGPAGEWQELCPRCKRRAIARAQLRAMEAVTPEAAATRAAATPATARAGATAGEALHG